MKEQRFNRNQINGKLFSQNQINEKRLKYYNFNKKQVNQNKNTGNKMKINQTNKMWENKIQMNKNIKIKLEKYKYLFKFKNKCINIYQKLGIG